MIGLFFTKVIVYRSTTEQRYIYDFYVKMYKTIYICFMLVITSKTTGKDKTYLMEKFKIYILRKHQILFNAQCAYQ